MDVRVKAMIEGGRIHGGDYCGVCKKSLYKSNEEKVRELFNLLSNTDLRGCDVLASNKQLLLDRGVTVDAEQYQEYMEGALKIFQLFQSASQNINK